MGYVPNVLAADYLVKRILPELNDLQKNTKVLIAGARPTKSVRGLASDNVDVSGWIDDIRDAYASGVVMMAPLFHGIGQQNKILEAMAMGIPCITTELVNNAIGASQEEEIMIANDPKQFAEAYVELINNPSLYQRISQNGNTFVRDKYDWINIRKKFNEYFN